MPEFRKYNAWVEKLTGYIPHPWQQNLAGEPVCLNRLIRIPTGMGKTLGVITTWLYQRIEKNNDSWPRRLVWCLPMRVLVEQTHRETVAVLEKLGRYWPGPERDHQSRVGVHLLMGGEDDHGWRYYPEHPAVLIGTQDMLLSRALNRGYGSPRGRWPMEYALLHNDALWVMDEVQLMDVGLATSVQLQAFREAERHKNKKTAHTWWMSATLQPNWLDTRDFRHLLPGLQEDTLRVDRAGRSGGLWEIRKPCRLETIPLEKQDKKTDQSLASRLLAMHRESEPGEYGRVTLAVVNTVDRARALFAALKKETDEQETSFDLHLIHSRFRGLEKQRWVDEFLHKKHCAPGTDRIIVATQVVEAGVDISATCLVTELAPWPNLVQRFGRAARYGGSGQVLVVDRELKGKDCLPYDEEQLVAARKALSELKDVSIASLEEFEEHCSPERLTDLYPYIPLHLLTRRENDELFDTGVDLTGSDLDISRFIRTGEERDLFVFWAEWDGDIPPGELRPAREGLCSVPVGEARKWLGEKWMQNMAWSWDYLENNWLPVRQNDLRPGMTLLVRAEAGGYHPKQGFTGEKLKKNDPPMEWQAGALDRTDPAGRGDLGQDREDLSIKQYFTTIATHGLRVAQETSSLASILDIPLTTAARLEQAARLHDWGKATVMFRSNILDGPAPDLAKAPQESWKSPSHLYEDEACGKRRGFRHELAAACGLFELLARFNRMHPALLGPYQEYLDAGIVEPPEEEPITSSLAGELDRLDPIGFNLLAYLVCAHHGKVRASWQATPFDQEFRAGNEDAVMGQGQPLRGVREGDELPACRLYDADGKVVETPALTLHLDPASLGLSGRYGESWTERCLALLDHFGPYGLAFLETLLRVADARASVLEAPDPLLEGEDR